jgi:hypothetical protein
MSEVGELKSDIRELEREHDALERTITRKHAEYDRLLIAIKTKTDALDKIRAEIARLKAHFGVS